MSNAGLYYGIGRNPTQDIVGDTWDRMMEINVKGTWQVAKAAFPLLAKNPGATNVFVGDNDEVKAVSIAARTA